MRRALGLLALLAGCFNPRPQPGAPCGANNACPDGLRCDGEGFCVVMPDDVDALVIDSPLPPDGVPRPPPGWYAVTSLPAARSLLCAVAANGNLYAIGGSINQVPQTTAWFAPIAQNGSLGAWTATAALPTATRWHGCAHHAASSSIYVVGGQHPTVDASTQVLRAPIMPGGALGAWQPQTVLPAARRGHGVAIDNTTLYVIGGEEADGFMLRNTVFGAPIGNDGKVGAWSMLATLPMPDYVFGTASLDGAVFLTGGYTNDRNVYSATATANALGPYVTNNALPGPRERHASVATDGFVYVIGGEPTYQSDNLRTVFRAPIQPGGTLGAWQPLPDLFDAIAYPSSATYDGYIYSIGGSIAAGQISAVQLLVPPP
jgi:hypothetical protein